MKSLRTGWIGGFALVLAACAGQATVGELPNAARVFTNSGASVDVSAIGGFAGIQTHQSAQYDGAAFVTVSRRICSTTCGAPSDSASGKLRGTTADSLFAVIRSQNPTLLKDDYGPTKGGADMMTYTIRVSLDGATKTITGDDGSLPPAARTMLAALHWAIDASR